MHVERDEESPLIRDDTSHVVGRDVSSADESQKSRTRVTELPMRSLRLFLGICLVAVLNGMQVCAFEPTILLYLKKVHLASDTDVSFFIFLTALAAGSPILGTLALSFLSSRIGAPGALIVNNLTVALGIATLIVTQSRAAFAFAFLCYGLSYSNRTVRQIFVAESVPQSCRTEAMSIHAFMTPFGALFGPTIWLMCNRFHGEFNLGLSVALNKFTLTYAIVVLINLTMVALAVFLHLATRSMVQQHESSDQDQEMLKEHRFLTSGRSKLMNMLFFSTLALLSSISMAVVFESFQPIMVNYMGADGAHIGVVYEIIIALELLPPLVVAFASRYLDDRTIMLVGFALKLFGGSLYLPILGPVREAQVIIGFALEGKASLFYETAMLSLLSSKFDPQFNGMGMGIVSSTYSFGYMFSMYALGVKAVELFGTLKFGLFVMPVFVALLMLIVNWKRLK